MRPLLRIATAGLLLAGGAIHLKLYRDGYRSFPNANLGRSFLLNAAGGLVMAVVVLVWRSRLAILAALGLVNATLVGFAASRSSRGIFGFTESGFQPSPEAALSLVVEIAAGALLVGLLALGATDGRSTPPTRASVDEPVPLTKPA